MNVNLTPNNAEPAGVTPDSLWLLGVLRRQSRLLIILAILASTVVLYRRSLTNDFSFDDSTVLFESLLTQGNAPLRAWWTEDYFTASGEASYRPIVSLTYRLTYWAVGFNPFWYNLSDLALHLMVVLLLYVMGAALFGPPTALLGATFFAIHPINTEIINSSGFREDLLAALGVAVTLWYFYRYGTKWTWASLSVLTGLALLTLFSKENTIILPFLAVATLGGLKGWASIKQYFPGLVVLGLTAALLLIVRFILLPNPAPDPVFGYSLTLPQRVFNAPGVLFQHLSLVVWPLPLTVDHRYTPIQSVTDPQWYLGAGLVYLLALGWKFSRGAIRWSIAWLAIGYTPVLNLYPLTQPISERFSYLPLIGIAIAIGSLSSKLVARSRYWLILLLFLCLPLAYRTELRNREWVNTWELFSSALRYPHTYRTPTNLGLVLIQQGKLAESLEYLLAAAALNPTVGPLYANISACYEALKRYPEAVQAAEQAIRLKPNNAAAYYNLGLAQLRLGRLDEAVANLLKSLDLDNKLDKSSVLLADIYDQEGNLEAAFTLLEQALTTNPAALIVKTKYAELLLRHEMYEDADRFLRKTLSEFNSIDEFHFLLGKLHQLRQIPQQALQELQIALALNPAHVPARALVIELAITLNDFQLASLHAKHLQQLFPDSVEAYYYRGLILSKQRRYWEAAENLAQALVKSPTHIPALVEKALVLASLASTDKRHLHQAANLASQAVSLTARKEWKPLYALAFVLYHQGNHETALEVLNEAVKASPEQVPAELEALNNLLTARR